MTLPTKIDYKCKIHQTSWLSFKRVSTVKTGESKGLTSKTHHIASQMANPTLPTAIDTTHFS